MLRKTSVKIIHRTDTICIKIRSLPMTCSSIPSNLPSTDTLNIPRASGSYLQSRSLDFIHCSTVLPTMVKQRRPQDFWKVSKVSAMIYSKQRVKSKSKSRDVRPVERAVWEEAFKRGLHQSCPHLSTRGAFESDLPATGCCSNVPGLSNGSRKEEDIAI